MNFDFHTNYLISIIVLIVKKQWKQKGFRLLSNESLFGIITGQQNIKKLLGNKNISISWKNGPLKTL
jgi:hypothetical protein